MFLSQELPTLLKNTNVTKVLIKTTSGSDSVSIPVGTKLSDALKLIGDDAYNKIATETGVKGGQKVIIERLVMQNQN